MSIYFAFLVMIVLLRFVIEPTDSSCSFISRFDRISGKLDERKSSSVKSFVLLFSRNNSILLFLTVGCRLCRPVFIESNASALFSSVTLI